MNDRIRTIICLLVFLFSGLCNHLLAQSYNMQVENNDGSVITVYTEDVKQVSFYPVSNYSISYSLTGVSSSNNASSIGEGRNYKTVLTPAENSYIYSVIITMNGNDITSTAYSNGEISIDYVYGNISITASSALFSEGIDLSLSGKANCYIVSSEGKYKFNIEGYDGVSAFLLWNENGIDDITDVKKEGNYIYFSKENFKKGNAMISMLDAEGAIVWSWHIWSTDQPQAIKVGSLLWMDRNLGATSFELDSIDSYGLRYNPGNPFPFPGPKYGNFTITETPAVPEGWYVAEGYGFYRSSKMPSPATPMQLCTRDDVYGNSVYFRIGYSPCPIGYYIPWAQAFQDILGYEPVIQNKGVVITDDLYIPLNSPNEYTGFYLCSGIYNSVAVDTWSILFYEGVSKQTYCQGAALMPVRCMSYSN